MRRLTYSDVHQDEDFLSFVKDYMDAENRRDRNVILVDMAFYFDVNITIIRMWLVRHGNYIPVPGPC